MHLITTDYSDSFRLFFEFSYPFLILLTIWSVGIVSMKNKKLKEHF